MSGDRPGSSRPGPGLNRAPGATHARRAGQERGSKTVETLEGTHRRPALSTRCRQVVPGNFEVMIGKSSAASLQRSRITKVLVQLISRTSGASFSSPA
jgi:hypothetical protein